MPDFRAILQSGDKNKLRYDEDWKLTFEKNDWKLVESVNSVDSHFFFQEFCYEGMIMQFRENVKMGKRLFGHPRLEMMGPKDMKKKSKTLRLCLDLIEETSKVDYDKSGQKWSRAKKEKEMLLPDMRYLVYYESELDDKSSALNVQPRGFASFMITYEDSHEVLYLYEIHFKASNQKLGYGHDMMALVERVASEVGVEKIMLTVFKSNEKAVKFYQRRGYTEDEFSPESRKFRNGTVKEPSYVILSKKAEPARDELGCEQGADLDEWRSTSDSDSEIEIVRVADDTVAKSPAAKRRKLSN